MERYEPTKIMHRVVAHAGMLHFSGIVADEPGTGMTEQTRQILDKFEALLERYGGSMDGVVAATIFITDMGLKDEMNAVWTERFSPAALPTRATIGVADLGTGYLIEVTFQAAALNEAR